MQLAHDLLERWPALGVPARVAMLKGIQRINSGPLRGEIEASRSTAARAVTRLVRGGHAVRTAEPAGLSADAGKQDRDA